MIKLQMSVTALNKQDGKPLINGLNPEWRERGITAVRRTNALRHSCHRFTTACIRTRMSPGIFLALSSIYGFEIGYGEWHGTSRNRRKTGYRPACFGPWRAAFGLHAADYRACVGLQLHATRP